MTRRKEDARKLIDLLSPGWDGTLTDSDNEKLDAFLRARGRDGAELLLEVSIVHLEMHKYVASTELFERVMASIAEEEDCRNQESSQAAVTTSKQAFASRSSFSWWRWSVAAIAASLLIVLGAHYFTWRADDVSSIVEVPRKSRLLRPFRPVANLISVSDAVWAEGSSAKVGETINENERLELLAGTAQLSMACGADIVLQAPCSVKLIAEDFVRLESGKLTAQAAEWATGFVVAANDLKVTDLGTRFALSANSEGVVEAHVLEGSVLSEPLKERRRQQASMLLESGQAIRVDGLQSKVDLIKTRSSEFIDELSQFRPLRPISIWNTGVGAKLGSLDPHWRVVAGSEEFGSYPRQATITDGDTGSYKDNRPEVSQWISVTETSYPGVPPESTHTFETTFDLTGYDLDTVYLIGYFLVDDAINELRINGHPVEYERWVTTWDDFDFKSFHPIEITDHFVPGENVISIKIYNSPTHPGLAPGTPNPSALRVEWQAFGCLSENTLQE
ncbi:MAG: hypothetical protein MI725_13430 [Pirellulales bacterium]|nr:hypothetical protein [Pirellulales bacterium]